jgi:acetylornithine deacetylase/succinyl-diaminopimelate desuccinylase-like protein
MALAIESYCRARADRLVGTVGKLAVDGGGAINVIPGGVSFTVDVRSPVDRDRRDAADGLRANCEAIAASRGVALAWDPFFELQSAPCDPALMKLFGECIAAKGLPVRALPSGAGHDAMEMARLVPSAMLFVRCGAGGISHNPAETLDERDADVATAVLLDFLERFQPPGAR